MDGFVDKIAQKINAQDMIRANAEAEAAEMGRIKGRAEQMERQVEQYDVYMQEMRKLNLENVENVQAIQELVDHARIIHEMMQNDRAGVGEKLNKLAEECIVRINEIQVQDSGKEEIITKLEELQATFSGYKGEIEEIIHKENVKVYRNVQAVVVEESGKAEKQFKKLFLGQEKASGRSKWTLAIVIISLIVGLGNLGLLIVQMLGILA